MKKQDGVAPEPSKERDREAPEQLRDPVAFVKNHGPWSLYLSRIKALNLQRILKGLCFQHEAKVKTP